MAFKLTYTDGQEDTYDDETAWTVEDGVLKMGHKEGDWTVLVSPSHWATVEVTKGGKRDGKKDSDDRDDTGDRDEKSKHRRDKDDSDDSDDKDSDEDDDKDE